MATVDRWLLPDGIEEVLPPEAARIEAARRQVLDLFQRWGYEFVVTPHIEYLESLLTGAGQDLDLRTFKVTDPLSGRQMGFRADITPQVARIDAHTMRREGPSRLCYAGSVLHAQPRALTTSRSPIQLGAELYGDASPASDIEVISLLVETLELAAVPDVHMDLGHVGIYRGLVRAAGLSGEAEQQLFDALQRKAMDEIESLTAALPAGLGSMLRSLAELCGGREVLDLAQAVLVEAPDAVHAALDELVAIADALELRYPELPLYFDLGELRGYNYHTGAVFAAFVPGEGGAIAQGGRYDDTGAVFGRARPATGFSTDLKTLVTLGDMRVDEAVSGVWAPDNHDLYLWQAVRRLRGEGERVVQALPGQSEADAREAGCDRLLTLRDGRWQVAPLAS
ncbi:ATP phosphoribosyltransferase regulatory subunit [Pseudomonas chengduensis]|jgi:ATP phosphoribosyltransferase regulatory subunit|uniref:ATP phosphoribosyltransferase regulatory subunit n=1 Tax=Ectopseudomonas chengduensis TaxID=489632 RepID=A0A1G6JWJ5_9GAMM|nr:MULTISPECIES: ATP phosphoribosyltransferase regulatory subunit [Pseudomonas]KQO44274.1 ATP phosphoribosyltransferase regulatory subunit [Pseudomonas sp. Leaf83]MBP3060423.1 ATP phosphoribosyltransferase regulatory subunit [Pseudomonas chengduensis]MDH1536345.1 ATP phosphoribosyltransferase regulatory subunit [Pseudomonas chengduensis]NNB72558.1 ATP phosphoribosyltransferase regulatory subunit [Pseudomonas chengduensis]SDC22765.1 ATP phosphoribosyltransferase regulatory subunit [Pseudomonas 